MKIVISQNTIKGLDNAAMQIGSDLGFNVNKDLEIGLNESLESNLANVTTELKDGNYEITVNDEIFFKYMNLYVKIAKFVKPFIEPAKMLFVTLMSDINDIERFLTQKK